MSECDFDRAENRHFTEAERLRCEANRVEENIDEFQGRIEELRERLRKDDHQTDVKFILQSSF